MELEKLELNFQKKNILLSGHRIERIMKDNELVFLYTIAQFKPQKIPKNEATILNQLNRKSSQTEPLRVAVSNLTYVRVDNQWNYICLFVDFLIEKSLTIALVAERMLL